MSNRNNREISCNICNEVININNSSLVSYNIIETTNQIKNQYKSVNRTRYMFEHHHVKKMKDILLDKNSFYSNKQQF